MTTPQPPSGRAAASCAIDLDPVVLRAPLIESLKKSERSLGLLNDLDQSPVLGGAQRTGLHDPDEIAGVSLIVLVVDLDLLGTTEDLAVQGVLVALLDEDDMRKNLFLGNFLFER